MKMIRRVLAYLLVLTFTCVLPGIRSGAANAEESSASANRYNVMLVMDKSGSLCDARGVGTDPDGLRYEAMRLFLGLLTETGNNVGVIAFDDSVRYDSGLQAVNSMDDKKALVSAVETLGTSYDTDIGSAVLRAVDALRDMKDINGLPCIVLLLTDGMTDFSSERPATVLLEQSRAAARKALETAQKAGITIHGILLNVDDRARTGEDELRYFTDGTRGKIETVSSPEDLTAAFRQFYSIINKTDYDNAHRIVFPEQGEVVAGFTVPAFGTEEVNLVIEGKNLPDALESIHVTAPGGLDYSLEEHVLETSRFLLVKIPAPQSGNWDVALKGAPGGTINIYRIYNASAGVALSIESARKSYEVLTPVRFHAVITDEGAALSQERLSSIACELAVKDPSTGETVRYPMHADADGYFAEVTFENGGEYEISAIADLTDFVVRSDVLDLKIDVPLPSAAHSTVSSIFELGSIHDNVWELSLNGLFEDPKGTGFRYSLSDDLGGAASIEDGVLRVKLDALGPTASFAVIATDAYGLSAQLPFDLPVSLPAANTERVENISEIGAVHDNIWEVRLDELFDSAGSGLSYSLSDDLGGAASIEDGVLRVKLDALKDSASFSVTAVDADGLSTRLPFDFPVSLPSAKVESVSDIQQIGLLQDGVWTLDLRDVFEDADGAGLTYTLSGDHGGAVSIEDGILRANLRELDPDCTFTVLAESPDGLRAELPFALALPAPATTHDSISSLNEGQIDHNMWELKLDDLFADPAGGEVNYALSDDLAGAAVIENGVLRVDLSKIGENASFAVVASNSRGQSVELPFVLSPLFPEAKFEQIPDAFSLGQVHDNCWELDLGTLFEEAKDDLRFTLSDDFGGAAVIEDGVLRLHPNGADTFSFTVMAANSSGLSTQLPISVVFPAPAAKTDRITETVKTGLFQNGTWQRELVDLFEDPKGTDLEYTLSDNFNGAVKIEEKTLYADCKGIGEAEFQVQATDSFGLSAEVPFRLVEQNMTWTILGLALLELVLLILIFLFIRRKRNKKP